MNQGKQFVFNTLKFYFTLGGGGRFGGDLTFDIENAIYTVYVRFDAMSNTHQPCYFLDGNLSRDQLTILLN